MTPPSNPLSYDLTTYTVAAVLVAVRLSGVMVFVPILSSAAIAPMIKAAFVIALTILLFPIVGLLPGARPVLDMAALLGELSIGLVFGLSLKMLTETLAFVGMLLGFQFSFSLVNLLDPNSMVDTPVLGQMLNWLGILVLIHVGFDHVLLAALIRTFCTVPVGDAVLQASTGPALTAMASGIFIAGLQLAAPVMAAAFTVDTAVALVGRLSPQLPAMFISIPLKTMMSYLVLIASLAVWPGWIDHHFTALLESGMHLVAGSHAATHTLEAAR